MAGYYGFHGTSSRIKDFDASFLNSDESNHENGPGIYFSSSYEDAKKYALPNGIVYHCHIDLYRSVSLTKSAKVKEIKRLILKAPNLYSSLEDWNENKNLALRSAIKVMISMPSAWESFKGIHCDFYRENSDIFVHQMTLLGYDGVIIHHSENLKHFIVFNPACIEILGETIIAQHRS